MNLRCYLIVWIASFIARAHKRILTSMVILNYKLILYDNLCIYHVTTNDDSMYSMFLMTTSSIRDYLILHTFQVFCFYEPLGILSFQFTATLKLESVCHILGQNFSYGIHYLNLKNLEIWEDPVPHPLQFLQANPLQC